ncbi:MAG TPA: hypothetical protein VLG28_15695 [Acidimicrobiia bacterium]|jgi:hypothetical protein|nr:hypothetical protein [Acidimicrobiia bacterium]
MLWYNNPEAITALHNETMRERHEDRHRRTLLRLVTAGNAVERH